MNDNTKKISNQNNFTFLKNITKDSYTNGILDNTFIIFKSINALLYLVYSKRKSIILFNLNNSQKISEIKNAHLEDISNFRHYLDKIHNIDLLLSLSKEDNNIKIWNIKNSEFILNIKKVNEEGWLYSSCFLLDNNNIYILSSNWNFQNSEYIKVFDLKGNKVKIINQSNNATFFIDILYDNKTSKNYIITSNIGCIKSYAYKENKIYHNYTDNDFNDHSNIIIYYKNEDLQLIETCSDGNIRIWNFNSGELIKKIKINEAYYGVNGICLWDNDKLFVGCNDKTIKLIELKTGNIIKSLMGHTDNVLSIEKINHPIYNECLISQGRRYDQIKIWIRKIK